MSTATSRHAYEDCFELLDQALETEGGVRAKMTDLGEAGQFRVRLHYARKLARIESSEAYPTDHPDHGKSVYDSLIISMRSQNGSWWIYIKPRKAPLLVEELTNEG